MGEFELAKVLIEEGQYDEQHGFQTRVAQVISVEATPEGYVITVR